MSRFTRFVMVTSACGVLLVAATAGMAKPKPAGAARFARTAGAAPAHIVLRHCASTANYESGLDIVALSDEQLILRCHASR